MTERELGRERKKDKDREKERTRERETNVRERRRQREREEEKKTEREREGEGVRGGFYLSFLTTPLKKNALEMAKKTHKTQNIYKTYKLKNENIL